MNKNLLLAIFGNVAPEEKMIKYTASEAVSGSWVDNNTDINRNTFVNGRGTLYLNDGVTTIGGGNSTDYSPFYQKTDVTSISLKYSGLQYIDSAAFYDCSNLTSVVIGNSVTTIGDNIFNQCMRLTSVVIGNSVTTIGNRVFNNCRSLTSITIGNSVTTIGNNAFADCRSLTSVVIGNSVTTIGDRVFLNCNHLRSVTCLAINPPALRSYGLQSENATLYVPAESVQAYLDNTAWNITFSGNIQAISQ